MIFKCFSELIKSLENFYKRRHRRQKLKSRVEYDKTSKYRKMDFLNDKRKK